MSYKEQDRAAKIPGSCPVGCVTTSPPAAYGVSMRGNGIFVHTDEQDRGGPEFRGTTTLYSSGARGRLLLPFLDPAV
jgi:hypothetical protein